MKTDKPSFVRLVTEAFRNRGLAGLKYDKKEFCLRFGDGEDSWVANLGNIYAEFRAASSDTERLELVRRFANSYDPSETDSRELEEVLPELLPRVRERAYFGTSGLQVQLMTPKAKGKKKCAPDAPPHRLLGEDLTVSVVHDREDSIRELNEDDYATWGVEFERVYDKALANLWQRSEEPFEKAGRGVWVSPWKDNHDASRILLTDAIRRLSVKGLPVALVPHRDWLIVTGSDDAKGLETMAELASELLEGPRPMSFVPLVLGEDDEWRTFEPAGAKAAARFDRLRTLQTAQEYAEQKDLIEKLHERDGEDIYVATYMVFESDGTGALTSVASWGEGVLTLLPRAKKVGFSWGENGAQSKIVSWERAAACASKLMKRVDGLYPERFLVESFPSKKQLAAMGDDDP